MDSKDSSSDLPGQEVVFEDYLYYAALQRQEEEVIGRQSSPKAAFYLITTDILGPFSAPYAVSQLGWVPGIILYFFSSVYSFIPRYILTYST